MQHHWRTIGQLCRALEAGLFELGVPMTRRIGANAYLTPARSQGFDIHYDDHCVFIVQLSGAKHWQVYAPRVELPIERCSAPIAPDQLDPPILEAERTAGDVLYLPRGFPHAARTADDSSLHLTLALHTLTWLALAMACSSSATRPGAVPAPRSLAPPRGRLRRPRRVHPGRARGRAAVGHAAAGRADRRGAAVLRGRRRAQWHCQPARAARARVQRAPRHPRGRGQRSRDRRRLLGAGAAHGRAARLPPDPRRDRPELRVRRDRRRHRPHPGDRARGARRSARDRRRPVVPRRDRRLVPGRIGARPARARPAQHPVRPDPRRRQGRAEPPGQGPRAFRPFAPATAAEHVDAWFDLEGTPAASPFMLRVCSVRPSQRARVPGVVHVDGTGRLQTIERGARLHELLEAFHARTGIPMLLNTSFNVMGEPIVETPEDAP